ncbi:MAG: hypothetical protein Q9175_006319 [Cornicularia normoerica]
MVEVLDEVRANKKLSEAAQWDDRDEFRDGLLARTPDEMRSVKAWKVMPGAVNEKTAEMTNEATWISDENKARPWDGVFTGVYHHDNDGHAAKVVRALTQRENICTAYSVNDPLFRIKGDMWLQLGHMAKLPQNHP